MKKMLLILYFSLFAGVIYAQNVIKGKLIDTVNQVPLKNAAIMLLNAKDSTLYSFVRTNESGNFTIKVASGLYILHASYPKYIEYVETIVLPSTATVQPFKTIKLVLKAHLLKEVVVKGGAAVIIRGDTTEFNASSYVINKNDKIEDLIKQFPGIQVDINGNITAQGKTVKKVLVDGEEFFGNDPTLVTKNLRADMVDKVQLFEKKSDQAAFTGIDDGERTQTLNVKLKAGKKNGYFGKLSLGKDPKNLFEATGALNVFRNKRKMAVYATSSNNGQISLGSNDNSKYSASGTETSLMEGGGIMVTFGSGGGGLFESGYNGNYTGKGLPTAYSAGGLYQNKWNNDKQSINAFFKTGGLNVDGVEEAYNQNNLQNGVFINTNTNKFENNAQKVNANAIFESKIDSLSSLKITLGGIGEKGSRNSNSNAESNTLEGAKLNRSSTQSNEDGTRQNANARIFYSKKFKKDRRTVSLSLNPLYNSENTNGFLKSENQFFKNNQVDSTANINQRKDNIINSQSIDLRLTYTEPISKSLSLSLKYIFNNSNALEDRRSYNTDTQGKYSILDSNFSSSFRLKQLSNQGGVDFNYKKNKNTIKIGSTFGSVNFDQFNQFNQQNFERKLINWGPQATYSRKLEGNASFEINYYGTTNQPSISQVNPVQINNDPLNIVEGNPNLKTSFRNSLSVYYHFYSVIKKRGLFLNASYRNTLNPIVSNTITNFTTGSNIFRTANISSIPTSIYASITFFKTLKNDFSLNYGLNLNHNTNFNMVNDVLNKNVNQSFTPDFSISKYKAKKYSLRLSLRPSYEVMNASLQPQLNNNSFNYSIDFNADYTLAKDFKIKMNVSNNYRGKSAAFAEPFQRTLVMASIEKKFLKEKNLSIDFRVNDALNQNVGFSRSASGNQINQNSYNTIRRFFMFNITWDFNKTGGNK